MNLILTLFVVAQQRQRCNWRTIGPRGNCREESVILAIFIFVAKHLNLYNNMKFSKTPEASFFTSWYFIVNATLVFAYPLMRLFTPVGDRSLRNVDSFGFTYENSIIYGGLSFVVMYYLRSSSLREFLIDCLSIGKIVVTSLLFFAKYQLCFIYIGICCLSWIFLSYPKYRAKNKFIRIESEQQFDELVGPIREAKNEEDDDDFHNYQYRDKKMFFVEFYADWLAICNISKQLWYEYSNRYSTPQLKFLQVDVTKLPNLAKRFNINTSGFTKQLPTVLILEDGQQTVRFPPIKENNKVDRIVKLDYKILLKYFDLQSRYLETRLTKGKKQS